MIELKIAVKWAAMDNDGGWYAFTGKPEPRVYGWYYRSGDIFESGTEMNDIFGDIPYSGDWKDSLHQIIEGRLVKYIDIPADGEKVIVGVDGYRRYSTGRLGEAGWLLCYNSGDKWTSCGATIPWKTWRRPTPEELE